MKRIFMLGMLVLFLMGCCSLNTIILDKNIANADKTCVCRAFDDTNIYEKFDIEASKTDKMSAFMPKIEFLSRLGRSQTEKINYKLSIVRQKVVDSSFADRVKTMRFAHSNGFSKQEAIIYAFPEVAEAVFNLENKLYHPPTDAKLSSVKNKAKPDIIFQANGTKLDKIGLFNDIYYNFDNFSKDKYVFEVKEKVIEPKVKAEELKKCLNLRGSFKTGYAASIQSRKNNIKKALACFDGVVIEPSKSLSFNETTGVRGESGGYEKAKIIKNGSFVTEFGGGVCQASTTLYNAALLADLEIVEVHPHSLPVSYVSPCFDAMVNSGSSDLVIRNNHDFPVVITTSCDDSGCEVAIYGCKNIYQIVRKSEKIEDLLQITTERTTDYVAYGFSEPLKPNEEKVVCFGKPGYRAIGKLEYYKNGELAKETIIRENTYQPTKQVILYSN